MDKIYKNDAFWNQRIYMKNGVKESYSKIGANILLKISPFFQFLISSVELYKIAFIATAMTNIFV